jgi:hypothetical protein
MRRHGADGASAGLGFNAETATTNTFQRPADGPPSADAAAAQGEFEQLARALAGEGVEVCVAQDSALPVKPDALFPNNWVSFHADGTLVVYPLAHASRRPERRQEVIDLALQRSGFRVRHFLDLSWSRGRGGIWRVPGAWVPDHVRIAYAFVSRHAPI